MDTSLGSLVCILALLCTIISSTPLERGPAGPLPQAHPVEPRQDVTVTKYEYQSAVDINPPYYDTACQVGGCTFNYEASNTTLINFRGPSNECSPCLCSTSPPRHQTRLASPHFPPLRSKLLPQEWQCTFFLLPINHPSHQPTPPSQGFPKRLRNLHLLLPLRRLRHQTPRSKRGHHHLLRARPALHRRHRPRRHPHDRNLRLRRPSLSAGGRPGPGRPAVPSPARPAGFHHGHPRLEPGVRRLQPRRRHRSPDRAHHGCWRSPGAGLSGWRDPEEGRQGVGASECRPEGSEGDGGAAGVEGSGCGIRVLSSVLGGGGFCLLHFLFVVSGFERQVNN